MDRLTKVGLAYVLGLVVCFWSGTSAAFAQVGSRGDPAAANWGQDDSHVHVWQNGRGWQACRPAACWYGWEIAQCTSVMNQTRVCSTRHVVETFKVVRISATVTVVRTDWDVGT
jgi:hypothetical protein